MKITIIGAGSIGGAMARGLLAKSVIPAGDLTLTTAHAETLEAYRPCGCRLTLDNREAVRGADIVALAVKPWLVVPVVREIRDVIDYEAQTIVCLAAGMDSATLIPEFGSPKIDFAYVIPNTAIEIGESVTFISPVGDMAPAKLMALEDIFGALGSSFTVPASKLGAGTSLASCGIAFAMRYARAAAEGGVELGFKPAESLAIVEQTVIGAMKIIQAHGTHPEAEIDRVTTPGGLTIKGLNAMEKAGFTTAVIEGLKASKS